MTDHDSLPEPQPEGPYFFAAADLGASSGRVILGRLENGKMTLEETARFKNGPVEHDDGIHWDSKHLFDSVVAGLQKAQELSGGRLESVGVDTWGVDYGRLGKDDQLLEEPFHYRDDRTAQTIEEFFTNMPAEELYGTSGLQVQPFNTIFQFAADKDKDGWDKTETILFTPDLLTFWLSGEKNAEVTIASTSGMLDPIARQWSKKLTDHLEETYGVPAAKVLPRLVEPGTIVGETLPGLLEQPIKVVAVPSHDTASAVVSVPARNSNFAFISSGTWSLVGLELDSPVLTADSERANFTNELGADGTVRYLQNIMGLWVHNECRRIWAERGQEMDLNEQFQLAEKLPALGVVVNINDERLFPPGDMPARLIEIASETGQHLENNPVAITRCIMDSLALAYRNAIDTEQRLAGRKVEAVHIVGGGSKNGQLCQLTAEATGLPVIAGPTEGTALGNLLVQARACGHIDGDLSALREVSRNSVDLKEYRPGVYDIPAEKWDEANRRAFRSAPDTNS